MLDAFSHGVTDLEEAVSEGKFIFDRKCFYVVKEKSKSIVIFSDALTEPPTDLPDTEDMDIQKGIEFVCSFPNFMWEKDGDGEYEYTHG